VGDLLGEHLAVDVGVDGLEDQAVEFLRWQGFGLPLDRLARVEAVLAGEALPARVSPLPCAGGIPYACTRS